MKIKLSDYILEQSISDASPNDIILEELIAQMDVYQALFNVYEKERLIQEAITTDLPPQNPTSIVQNYDDRPTSSATGDSGIDKILFRYSYKGENGDQEPIYYDIYQTATGTSYILSAKDIYNGHTIFSVTIPASSYSDDKYEIQQWFKNQLKYNLDNHKDEIDKSYKHSTKEIFDKGMAQKNFKKHCKTNLDQGPYIWQLLFLISGILIYYVDKNDKKIKEEKRRSEEKMKSFIEEERKDREEAIKRKKIISLYYEIININQDVINTNDLSESFQADIVKRYKRMAEQLINSDTSVEKIGKMQSKIDSDYAEITKLKNMITRPDTKEKLIINYNKFNPVNAKSIIESFNSIKSSLMNIK